VGKQIYVNKYSIGMAEHKTVTEMKNCFAELIKRLDILRKESMSSKCINN
jgi:hypothetical protein